MRKTVKWIGVAVVALFLLAQLYQPERLNPPVDESKTIQATLPLPDEVRTALTRACYDCHSNETTWPWYSSIAPASWLVSNDVREGRLRLNFSAWKDYRKSRQINKLDEIANQVHEGEMPLKKYLLLHPGAALSKTEIDLLVQWAEQERERLTENDSTDTSEK